VSGLEGKRGLRTSDYDYHLPPERIAQTPRQRRDEARLLVVYRDSGAMEHRTFADLAELVPAGDAVVLNTTRVIRARLLGRRENGASAEVLLLRPLGGSRFEAMVHPGGKLKPGRKVLIAPDFHVEIEAVTERRTRIVRLVTDLPPAQALERFGHVPLPPYIRRPDTPEDEAHYQTVYARVPGSVAAPTAGLHFTRELLDRLSQRGVLLAEIVLHIGAGTFKPVESEDPAQHQMHEEFYSIEPSTATALNAVRARQGHIWAVGTTVARTLETVADDSGVLHAGSGETRLFIRPPYRWKAVDRLLTNFHLPRSTLLMLVAAFAGYELTMEAYAEALRAGYMFYSYGDAMLIV
jgi:S-adenosylmethionine:tRNA ribosyltransferase-isomerase